MRVGLLGGSFDPIHNAHLRLAKAARKQLKLDRVYFVLAGQSPFKSKDKQSPASLRLRMVKRVLKGMSGFFPATWELKRKGPSYTVDTLRWYKKKHPRDDVFFILGSDAYATFHKWKKANEIRGLCVLVVGRRPKKRHPGESRAPGFKPESKSKLTTWTPASAGATLFLHGLFPDISSTVIRKNISLGKSTKGKIPEPIRVFIRKKGLYQNESAL